MNFQCEFDMSEKVGMLHNTKHYLQFHIFTKKNVSPRFFQTQTKTESSLSSTQTKNCISYLARHYINTLVLGVPMILKRGDILRNWKKSKLQIVLCK